MANLTGEGGRLRTDVTLLRGRDFELVPESLWKALVQWYGGAPGLPRQVSRGAVSLVPQSPVGLNRRVFMCIVIWFERMSRTH